MKNLLELAVAFGFGLYLEPGTKNDLKKRRYWQPCRTISPCTKLAAGV
jgi:hypothetical protein